MLSMQVKPINNPMYYFAKENYYFSNQLTTEWVDLVLRVKTFQER